MADLVNSTHKSALSPRNSEPTHLNTGSYEAIGGPGTSSEPGGPDYKLDATRGVTTDTSIPRAVSAEPTHLKTEADDDVDVSFGDEDGDGDIDADDLDAELDQFEDVDPVDVDVTTDDDEDDKKKVDEDDDSKDDEKDKSELDEDENPFAKKDDDEKSDDDKEKVDEDDDSKDDEKEKSEVDEDDDSKDDEKEKDELKETFKVRIKLPKFSLNESVIPAKNQKKVAALFEQAVRATTKQVSTQLHAHYKKLHESKIAKRDVVMAKQMDAYLSYVVEEWVKDNKVSIRQSLRAQLAEEFLDGLQKLFKEHYIDVPESKVNVVKKLTEQNEKLRKSLNEQHATKLKLKRLAEAANKARIVAESSRGLSEAQIVKVQKLVEDVQYTTSKDFRAKLSVIMETYVSAKPVKKTASLPEADVKLIKEEKVPAGTDPDISAIADVLSRQSASEKW
jgi:hypothetical protein